MLPATPSSDAHSVFSPISETPIKERLGLGLRTIIPKVHDKPITCLTRLDDGTFVTGSEDGLVKKWTLESKLVRIVQKLDLEQEGYPSALATLNENCWLVGTTHGRGYCWDNSGQTSDKLSLSRHISKDIATLKQPNSINCFGIVDRALKCPYFFTGWPTQFTEDTLEERVNYTYTSENASVTALYPITADSLLVATGLRFENWRQDLSSWQLNQRYSNTDYRNPQHFITAILPLQKERGIYSITTSEGSIQVYDITARAIIFHSKESPYPITSIEKINPNCFATCDSGYIRLWDIRLSHRIPYNVPVKSKVTLLHKIDDNQLMSCGFPSYENNSIKAHFSYYDYRQIPLRP